MCQLSPKAKQTFFLIRVHPCSSACPMKSLLHLFHRGVLIVLSFETRSVQLFCKYGINQYLQPINKSTNQRYLYLSLVTVYSSLVTRSWTLGYMPKNLPSLKARQLIRLLESGGCKLYRQGKGDHKRYQHPYPALFP
jgi:hypothetical protein